MKIGFLVFDNMTALDLFGPLDVFSRVKDLDIELVSCTPGRLHLDNSVIIEVNKILDMNSKYDVIILPGGAGQLEFCENEENLMIIKNVARQATYILTICTGSLILGMCGLLTNKNAVTHWMAMDVLERLGANPINDRVVEDGNIITCSGVSAGIDMSLFFIKKIFGEFTAKKIQLLIEYDPAPEFDYKDLKNDEELKDFIYSEKQKTIDRRHNQVTAFLDKNKSKNIES